MAKISHKLKNSFEGALAGGGDPATSPLYVFGPFLKLIFAAGVAKITFGGAIWLAVFTIGVVSAMYRLVMQWVTDGSGGSGLSEEEFGGWAVKINAAITFIEYTLTFLVSMSAMVTFIADRIPILNGHIFGIQYRTFVAVLLSLLTGWLVNRGPKAAARAFGPATAGVLILLWAMIIATVARTGLILPEINLKAFSGEFIHVTLGGYVRILAVMTGIEVFANLVAAYDGTPNEKSRKAFFSLIIVMGTTAITMLIVGPAIFEYSDPFHENVSVFTQTMDFLLPAPLPYFGSIVGIAVLMSASAASAQGLQNLALGLRERHYIPPIIGERNKYEVADKPVWIEVGIVSFCFIFFGTSEETYLALYAAGVFILLSMTGWAVSKRLFRLLKETFDLSHFLLVVGTTLAAGLTTAATISIFGERFLEGVWTYLIFVPVLYYFFSYFRNRMGAPTPEMDYLGQIDAALLAGFGFGQSDAMVRERLTNNNNVELQWQPEPKEKSRWREQRISIERCVVLLDGSGYAAQALPMARFVSLNTNSHLTLLASLDPENENSEIVQADLERYLQFVKSDIASSGIEVDYEIRLGRSAEATRQFVQENKIGLVITSTRGRSGERHWASGGLSSKLVHLLDIPIMLVQTEERMERPVAMSAIDRIVVGLDGSIYSEQTLPYARAFAKAFNSEIVLVTVPAVPESERYRAPSSVIQSIRVKAEINMKRFNEAVARSLREDQIEVTSLVTGTMPAKTLVEVSEERNADLIMITSQGRGGLDLLMMGSVAQSVVQLSEKPVLIVPINR